MYSPQLLEHFQHPRNAGELADADVTGIMENPACGDILQLSLKFNDNRIAQAGFKARGCVAAMACGSALTELLVGRTVEEAASLRREHVIAAVGGLPQASGHAAQLALDVLAATLRK